MVMCHELAKMMRETAQSRLAPGAAPLRRTPLVQGLNKHFAIQASTLEVHKTVEANNANINSTLRLCAALLTCPDFGRSGYTRSSFEVRNPLWSFIMAHT